MNIRELINEAKERCPQCGMTDCTCAPGKCKCKPVAGWIPNKGFKKQGVAEGSTNDYFKRRKDEEDRIAGTKAPAKRTPKQTDYEKKRKEQGVAEVAGAQKCWPGHRKVGTKPGTGKNAGKRVNDCEKIGEDHEIQMADSELKSIYQNSRKLLRLIKHYSEQEGLEAWQQSKITKAADYLNSVLQSVSGQQTR